MKHLFTSTTLLIAVGLLCSSSFAETSDLLSAPRIAGSASYRFTTEYKTYAPDGTELSSEKTILDNKIKLDASGKQTLTCTEFRLVDAEGNELSIPELRGYQNVMQPDAEEVLGINHADFVGIKTDDNTPLSPELQYRVYNTFVDFYTFNNVFAQPVPDEVGGSIDDLHQIGQVVEHHSAYSSPPVDLADSVKKGSYFKNGRVTLKWKGSSEINGSPCEIVDFDSGESSFEMFMEPAPEMNIHVKGGSQYWGDLLINSDSMWVEEANFIEIVISKMEIAQNPEITSVIKRIGKIERL